MQRPECVGAEQRAEDQSSGLSLFSGVLFLYRLTSLSTDVFYAAPGLSELHRGTWVAGESS